MAAPDFVVVGHAVQDLVPGGWRLGGTVTFAAALAHQLGLRVGVVTRAAADIDIESQLPFAEIARGPSDVTTTFENVYVEHERHQKVRARADDISREDIPAEWRDTPIALLGPVFGEIGADFASAFSERTLVGVSAQGWLRKLDDAGNVVRTAWSGEPFWRGCSALFVSDEDLADGEHQLDAWTRDVPIVAVTASTLGARVHDGGRWRRMEAFPETEIDPTGAGDTFAAAFLIRLHEIGDVAEAARFGAAAASLSVAGVGAAAMPARGEIDERLWQHTEVRLR